MGRASINTFTDRQGRTFELTVTADAAPMHLVRVRLNNGGYDSGGAYWGHGAPLYAYSDQSGSITGYLRAMSREAAKLSVRAMFPGATFYR
jgi:hypothetical protein